MKTDTSWWKNAAVYEIYIRSFFDSDGDGIGDLNGIRQKLPYLSALGVDAIWITPFFQSPGVDNGYDISDYYAVDPQYGTMEDFRALLAEAHERGIRIILDMVLNHTSALHPWFQESRASRASRKRDWYIWRDEPNNWGSQFGGSAWHRDRETGQYYLGLFSAAQPDLNWQNPQVRGAVKDVLHFWADMGVDGFRLDVISLIAKPEDYPDGEVNESGFADFHPFVANNPRVHDYLRELNAEVFAPYALFTVGEASAVTLAEARKYCAADRHELSTVFSFEHVGLDGSEEYKWTDRRIDLEELKRVLLRWQEGAEACFPNALFWCNHDQPRIVSRLGDKSTYRERSAKMLAAALYGMRGVAFVYQGQELGMLGGGFSSRAELRDIESLQGYDALRRAGYGDKDAMAIVSAKTRDNARTPMQWSAGRNAGFSSGEPWIKPGENHEAINAEEQLERGDSVFAFTRELLRLRREDPCLSEGRLFPCEDKPGVLAYERRSDNRSVLVVCNLTAEDQRYPCPEGYADGRVLLSNCPGSCYTADGRLMPYECAILEKP